MTDLVERLRTEADGWSSLGLLAAGKTFAEAADEIERLEEALGKTERDLEKALAALDHHLKADR